MEYELERADALWKELLLHQFHDILPGSMPVFMWRQRRLIWRFRMALVR
jgi:alpha-mannosidase